MASKLQMAMATLVDVFHSYSAKEGDKSKLSKAELKNLFQAEFGGIPAVSVPPKSLFTATVH